MHASSHWKIGTPSSIVVGNHNEWEDDHEEIATKYVKLGESYHRKTTIIDIYFASKIVDLMDLDPEPKSMIRCWKRSDWDKWKAAIEAECARIAQERFLGLQSQHI